MTADLITRAFTDVSLPWKWRTRAGEFMTASEMETRHLFYTFRMIWNNFAPEHCRVGTVRLYRFGPEYTESYFRDAVRHVGAELRGRQDLKPWQRDELNQMAAYFVNRLAPEEQS